jgi:tRNA dimethylallyltransferase
MDARIWLIAGPTASGKSALALRLAKATNGIVVNADSMQIYADLRILTARPSSDDELAAPHRLYGIADATETWSVGRWLRAALDVIAECRQQRRPAIVVGGTGLYFRALTRGLAEIPRVPGSVRRDVQATFDRLGENGFRDGLADVDPESASRIGPGDRQRLTRALEVWRSSGRPLTAWQAETSPALEPGSWSAVVLDPPRDELYRRCDERLEVMMRNGAIAEVASLLARNLAPGAPAMKAVGVSAFAEAVAGRATAAEALALAQTQTRRYARRQMTWFRHQTADWPRIRASSEPDQWRDLLRLNPALTRRA